MQRLIAIGFLLFILPPGGGFGQTTNTVQPAALLLKTEAQVDSGGVFLNQIATRESAAPLPAIRLADAPAVGQALTLTPAQVDQMLRQAASGLTPDAWAGAARVRITRRERTLNEPEVKELLTAALQHERLPAGDELELRFTRAWTPVAIPDEPFTLKVTDLPASGINSYLILRFQLGNARETFGAWQVAVQARVWREVLVAKAPLKRGQLLLEADLARERRDVLAVRDTLAALPARGQSLEMVLGLSPGQPLTPRAVRIRPLVFRGQVMEACAREGALTVSLLVEVLEDGVAGDLVRLRNPRSKRELHGLVQDEKTIRISL